MWALALLAIPAAVMEKSRKGAVLCVRGGEGTACSSLNPAMILRGPARDGIASPFHRWRGAGESGLGPRSEHRVLFFGGLDRVACLPFVLRSAALCARVISEVWEVRRMISLAGCLLLAG